MAVKDLDNCELHGKFFIETEKLLYPWGHNSYVISINDKGRAVK